MSWVAVGVGGAGLVMGGASMLSQDKPLGPRASIRATGEGTIRGYRDTLPASLALTRLYNPQFLAGGSQDLQRLLFGGGEESYSQSVPDGKKGMTTISGKIPGSTGILDTIEAAQNRLRASNQRGNDSFRQSEMDSIAKYLPQARALFAESNPEQARLQAQLGADASEQLALGDRVNPELAANWRNANTAQYANMGFRPNEGFVQADDFMRYTGGAQALRTGRQGYALNALNTLNDTTPEYSSFIRNMQDPSMAQGQGLVTGQQPLTFTGNQYDPYNANTTSLSNRSQELDYNSDVTRAKAAGTTTQGGLDVLSSLTNAFGRKKPGM